MSVKVSDSFLKRFVNEKELTGISHMVKASHRLIHKKNGLGSDFLGWVDLPVGYDKEEFARIKEAASKIQGNSDVLVVIGIGGSYAGARAAIEFLKSPFYNSLKKDTPEIYFAGNNLSSTYLSELLSICEGRNVSVNVISKSGTTTEPALAFRVFRELLEQKYGAEGAKDHIFVTTDKAKGTLLELSRKSGYETFVVPDDVGGRYSVLTAVGLLPIAAAGIDIDALMEGAAAAGKAYDCDDLSKNECYRYAAYRNILYNKGKSIELLVSYEPSFAMMAEWFKQLFGESEGKDGKGLFPASVTFSTDLHSMGQFIQDGSKLLFETVVDIRKPKQDFFVKPEANNFDGLNFLSDHPMSYISRKAMEGTLVAHTEGGVPNILIEIDEADAYHLGWLFYFFEKACAMSGYLLGVNPFDQPGVESYKRNMFALLGKPGYEELTKEIAGKLK